MTLINPENFIGPRIREVSKYAIYSGGQIEVLERPRELTERGRTTITYVVEHLSEEFQQQPDRPATIDVATIMLNPIVVYMPKRKGVPGSPRDIDALRITSTLGDITLYEKTINSHGKLGIGKTLFYGARVRRASRKAAHALLSPLEG